MKKYVRRWANKLRNVAAHLVWNAWLKPTSFSSKRAEIRIGSVTANKAYRFLRRNSNSFTDINPGFEAISIYRRKNSGKKPRYEGSISSLVDFFMPHEAGHVYQALFHDLRGFRIKPNSYWGVAEDSMIRFLGFNTPSDGDVFSQISRSKRKPFSSMKFFPVVEVARHFDSPKSFLRAVVAMYRSQKCYDAIKILNNSFSSRREEIISAEQVLVDFFENYLKKHPQRSP